MNKEVIVREIINKVRNDEKLDNKEKDYLLCIGNDWFLFKEKINKVIEYIKNDMPYLEKPDDDYENNHKMIEYDKTILLEILGDKE